MTSYTFPRLATFHYGDSIAQTFSCCNGFWYQTTGIFCFIKKSEENYVEFFSRVFTQFYKTYAVKTQRRHLHLNGILVFTFEV